MPVIVGPNLVDIAVLPKLLGARLVVMALALVLAVSQLRRGSLAWRFTPLDVAIVAFLVSALISTVLAVNTTVALQGLYERYQGYFDLVTYFALYWLTFQVLRTRRDAWLVIRAIIVAGWIVSLIAIVQVVSGSVPVLGLTLASDGRADATFANPTILGAFFAMTLPLAVHELIHSRSVTDRLLFANATLVIALGVTLTLTRSAWISAALGIATVLISWHPRRAAMVLAGVAAVSLFAVGGTALLNRLGSHITAPGPVQTVINRAQSITQPLSGSGGTRVRLWKDTLALIAARPIVGFGPDTFGIVYPTYQTGNWEPGALFDRPHEEVLQVAASQGLIGVGAYLLMVGAILRTFWQGRRQHGAWALLGALVAYEGPTQLNFSLASAEVPFVIFLAAAVTIWGGPGIEHVVGVKNVAVRVAAAVAAALVAAAIALLAVARPFLADAQFLVANRAWDAGDIATARMAAADARSLAPDQSEYAILTGDLALDLDNNGLPSGDANYPLARHEYEDAVRLGAASPEPYRELARTYKALGMRSEAIATAQRAVELNRFDPINAAVLAEVSK